MEKRDLHKAAADLAAAMNDAPVPPGVSGRLGDRIRRSTRRRIWERPLTLAFAAGMALLVSFLGVRLSQPQYLGWMRVEGHASTYSATQDTPELIELASGSASTRDEAGRYRVRIGAPARLSRSSTGVRVEVGMVEFDVERRSEGEAPLRIEVSHGVIEVLGTRFTIQQEAASGKVSVHTGTIRFVSVDGPKQLVSSGESLSWPMVAAVVPVSPPTIEAVPPLAAELAPEKTRAKKAPRPIRYRDPEDLLHQVDALRGRGEFDEAVRYLRHGLTLRLVPLTHERFSYELGSILTYRTGEHRAACLHWRGHLRQHGEGRYGQEVRQAMAAAGCQERR
jgi:transmembrane sensor